MKTVYLACAALLMTLATAERSLLASSTDAYGIVAGVEGGNGTAAATGFVSAGKAQDTNAVVTALVQLVSNGMGPGVTCSTYYVGRDVSEISWVRA